MWDIRNPSTCERKITAHHGLAMTLAWHPEERSIIASGGRDRLIKVWDLNPHTTNPKHTIQTIASLGRMAWRPNHPSHIASIAALGDLKIHVWLVETLRLSFVLPLT